MNHYLINTTCGPIQGRAGQVKNVVAYLGIRYATAGRWEYPVQVRHWENTYDATDFGHCCYQPRAFHDESQDNDFYYKEFRKDELYTYSEDCLFLNIWTPVTAKDGDRLPVLVFIHGGGYTGGCGHEKHLNRPIWPTKGVIAVTINYRLGPLGFLCLPELVQEAGHTGNYALYDQMTALCWIRDNISAFGGDPNNVTIMGQSAGAMSVQYLSMSPLTDGLFHKAVMSSGGVNKLFAPIRPEVTFDFWHMVMERSGCKNLAEFRVLPAERLFEAWQSAAKDVKGSLRAIAACLDGKMVTGTAKEILQVGSQKNIPYLAGSTSEDALPPMMFHMGKKWCTTQALQGKQPSFTWFFDRQLPGDKHGAWHSSDLWYWFGTLDNSWRPMTEKDYSLSNLMTDYLTNFAKTGNPNGPGLPVWEAMSSTQKKVNCFGEGTPHMSRVNQLKLIAATFSSLNMGG